MDERQADISVVTARTTIVELHRYLEDPLSRDKLYSILRSYVRKFLPITPSEVDDEAYELLQNVVVKAMEIADKYHGTGIASWLLSIGINLIRQKKKSQAIRQEKVVQLSTLHRQDYPLLSKEAIASLDENDQLLLNYYIHYGYDHNEIARLLGIKPGAARTRYSRAVSQLRILMLAYKDNKGGERDA